MSLPPAGKYLGYEGFRTTEKSSAVRGQGNVRKSHFGSDGSNVGHDHNFIRLLQPAVWSLSAGKIVVFTAQERSEGLTRILNHTDGYQ